MHLLLAIRNIQVAWIHHFYLYIYIFISSYKISVSELYIFDDHSKFLDINFSC